MIRRCRKRLANRDCGGLCRLRIYIGALGLILTHSDWRTSIRLFDWSVSFRLDIICLITYRWRLLRLAHVRWNLNFVRCFSACFFNLFITDNFRIENSRYFRGIDACKFSNHRVWPQVHIRARSCVDADADQAAKQHISGASRNAAPGDDRLEKA